MAKWLVAAGAKKERLKNGVWLGDEDSNVD
jgi:hypothetical protein